MQLKATTFNNILKPILFLLLLAPTIWLIAGLWLNTLGANPIEYILHTLGDWALRILLLTLLLSPLRRLLNWIQLVQLRRMMGLFTFYYASLHLLCYLWFEQGFNLSSVYSDVWDRPFILFGMTAFLFLIPLAITSTRNKMRQLGRRWKVLHMLVYPAVIFGVVHFWWLVKADTTEPLIYALLTFILLTERLWRFKRGEKSGA
ncbi:sulfite oxidase heme-binding subunit YedZ [Leucothrix pacifica]|uniref:Protein-methionine-sulfoxide reductase heme-binding subunit MsrQ n=1 Tax=Leucothrix pacifica TaxID=1247513 RepID=A0A317C6M4_9GAMM|nr:protein-methionine-sulfoxide reductase heme-binding subunit MsrQ [Leucothrix pacifica]PWQ93053.1 sulfoxide reductase heme-binding subunit YedZ [Leucothrix pacifica]